MELTTLDFVVIIAYFAGMAGIGTYFAGRQTSRDEYFLGGRRTHWMLAGGSILATLLSSISYLSLPGEMIRYGFGFFAGVLSVPLVVPLMSYTLLPALKRLPITSVYEYLDLRFSTQVRTLAGSIFLIRTVLWMGLIIYTASFAMVEITGWNIYATILVIGAVTTFYTSAGGLQTVIWTDNLQLLILFGGALAIPVFIGFSLGTGPLVWWDSFSQAGRSEIQTFSWDPMVRITLVGALLSQFFWNICTQASDQVAVQRLLSTPSLKEAQRSLWMYAVANVTLLFMLAISGLALFAYYAAQSGLPIQEFQEQVAPEADKLMPRFIVQVLPPGVSGLLVAALLAAAMSSLSSGINSISSVISSDFMKRSGAGEGDSLWFDRFSGVVAGFTGLAMACLITMVMEMSDWNLVELTGRVNHIFVGPIGVLFFAGILFRRAGKTAALAGFVAATAISLYVCFGREWFGLEQSVSFLWVVPASFVGGLVTAKLVSLVTAPPPDEKTRGLTYLRDESS
ncbi:MAG: sodium/solute symporter [Acidobacteria bacterium]|nr:sodium/solute symporter [Acidobacteriota bacterium]